MRKLIVAVTLIGISLGGGYYVPDLLRKGAESAKAEEQRKEESRFQEQKMIDGLPERWKNVYLIGKEHGSYFEESVTGIVQAFVRNRNKLPNISYEQFEWFRRKCTADVDKRDIEATLFPYIGDADENTGE